MGRSSFYCQIEPVFCLHNKYYINTKYLSQGIDNDRSIVIDCHLPGLYDICHKRCSCLCFVTALSDYDVTATMTSPAISHKASPDDSF